MTEHPSFDQLCDLHDGELDVDASAAMRTHLATCAGCAEQLSLLTTLADATAALPATIEPPSDLWADIKAELAPRRNVRQSGYRGWSVWQLAAAAVIIAVSSSALTMMMTRRGKAATGVTATAAPDARPQQRGAVALPALLASQESGFTRSVDVLQHTLDERRDSLAPSTVETVERSLRVADSAIVEARDALAHDPANRALAKLFASNYERKIDLLKRATELAPRT